VKGGKRTIEVRSLQNSPLPFKPRKKKKKKRRALRILLFERTKKREGRGRLIYFFSYTTQFEGNMKRGERGTARILYSRPVRGGILVDPCLLIFPLHILKRTKGKKKEKKVFLFLHSTAGDRQIVG